MRIGQKNRPHKFHLNKDSLTPFLLFGYKQNVNFLETKKSTVVQGFDYVGKRPATQDSQF